MPLSTGTKVWLSDKMRNWLEEPLKELTENILPFWLRMRDPSGGFFGEADAFGNVLPQARRGTVLNARILWAFSEAYRLIGREEYLKAARWERDYFMTHFFDREHGGVWWSVDADGTRPDTKKQLYAQAFAIYGLSAWCLAVPEDSEALKRATELFSLVEEHFLEEESGYVEALGRDFSPLRDMSLSSSDINAPRTMNSHIHLMEAYAALYRIAPLPEVEAALRRLLRIVSEVMTGPNGHLSLYFERDWTVIPAHVSCGHDIETSWLLMECAEVLGDDKLTAALRPVAARLAAAGNEAFGEDMPVDSQWWEYAEAVVGNLWAGDEEKARRIWCFIRDRLSDSTNGEWFWSLHPDGTPNLSFPKAGFWKCPYHNTRMCIEMLNLSKKA